MERRGEEGKVMMKKRRIRRKERQWVTNRDLG